MAWLEKKGGDFSIRFRFARGKPFLCLKTTDRREAEAALGRFETHLRLIEQGLLPPPPDGADVGTYILSGGKLGGRPSRDVRAELKTLAGLFESYLADYPKGAKEGTTLKTERIHIAHLRRLLDTKLPLVDVTTRTIQAYVDVRAADVGTETVKKEVGTFAAVWNKWAVPQGMVKVPAPTAGMVYRKGESNPLSRRGSRSNDSSRSGRSRPTRRRPSGSACS